MTVNLCEEMDIGKSAAGGWNYIQRLLTAEGIAENSGRFRLAEEQFGWFQPAVTRWRNRWLQRICRRWYRRRRCLTATLWARSLRDGRRRAAPKVVGFIHYWFLLYAQTVWNFIQNNITSFHTVDWISWISPIISLGSFDSEPK